MNEDMYRSLKDSWAMARKRRAVDKKGLAVALAFLVVMFFVVRTCSDTPTERVSHALQGNPEFSSVDPGQTIATIFCDSGAKYQSKHPEWQAANGLRADLSVETLVAKL